MIIKILGSGCNNCVNLERSPAKPSPTSAWTPEIEKVTDYGAIAGYGIMSTPGLVVDEKVVLSGRVPTAAKVRELLESLTS